MGSGLAIQGAALPVALLPNHSEQSVLMAAQSFAALTQAWAIELEVIASKQHAKNVHALVDFAHGQGEAQTQHIGGGWLRFNLTLQNRVQKTDRQKRLGQPRAQHLHIHSVGQIAQPTLQRLVHGMDPVQQGVRLAGEEMVASFHRLIHSVTPLKGLLGLLHRITSELKQGAKNVKIP